jgi:hypothetical protein
VPRSRIGKTLILKTADFVELLERLECGAREGRDGNGGRDEDGEELGGAADILERAGLMRAGGRQ